MAMKCRHCGSLDTQAGAGEYTCLSCGRQSAFAAPPPAKPARAAQEPSPAQEA